MRRINLILVIILIILVGVFTFLEIRRYNKDGEDLENNLENMAASLNENAIVREPAFAGQFYPAAVQELDQMMKEFLAKVKLPEIKGQPQILIVPHAGYVFSGQTAAYGFKALENYDYENVIVLGSSHNYPLEHLALYSGDGVKTPLGKIKINQQIVEELKSGDQNIIINDQAHLPEHSLEVQIPWLQKVLGQNFQLILGLINNDNLEPLELVAESIYKILEKYPSTLVVISSDLSHYPNYEDAKYSDGKILEAILSKDVSILGATNLQILAEGREGLGTCACGLSAIKIGVILANKLNLDGELLNYSNSGDNEIYGDRERVVGYGAVIFSRQETISKEQGKYLNDEEQGVAVKLARNTLELEFGLTKNKFEDYKKYLVFDEKRGVFVTLNKHGQLRGCIGLIEPIKPLGEGIIEMAKSAAFNDHRFMPLTKEEFGEVEIEVSVLTPPVKISNPQKEIELGKHGVIIRSGERSGVFLPQVATETGWDFKTFMGQLCSQKAGLDWECWKDGAVDVYTFEAQKIGNLII